MSDEVKIGTQQFYDFSNGDLRRANTPTVSCLSVNANVAPLSIGYQAYMEASIGLPKIAGVKRYNVPVQQEPMTLERAVEILNEREHRGIGNGHRFKWKICVNPDPNRPTSGIYPQGELTRFEVIAVAKAYLEEQV